MQEQSVVTIVVHNVISVMPGDIWLTLETEPIWRFKAEWLFLRYTNHTLVITQNTGTQVGLHVYMKLTAVNTMSSPSLLLRTLSCFVTPVVM